MVRFLRSTLGKKVIMALTGVILFGFVVGHLLGNLQIFAGPDKINAYAQWLRENALLVWGARAVLLLSVVAHIVCAVQLAHRNSSARPVGYLRYAPRRSTYASRTMVWSGPLIALYVIYHLLHFTFGAVHPDFKPDDVYANMVHGFRVVPVSIAYIVAMLALGYHLYHGLWSMFQTVGIRHSRYDGAIQAAAQIVTILIVIGYLSIPVSVLAGVVKG